MSQQKLNDDVDLKQVLGLIKKVIKSFLLNIIAIVSFYKKKWILFLTLIIVGSLAGYFLDYFFDNKKNYIQRVIITPKYGSTDFIYDFVKTINEDKNNIILQKSVGLKTEEFNHLRDITIEPIVVTTDLLELYSKQFGQNDYYKILEDYTVEDLKSEKFRNLYKNHLLIFRFTDKDENSNLVGKVLSYLKSNTHYSSKRDLLIAQAKVNIEKSKESLNFIDTFLENKTKSTNTDGNSIMVVSETVNTVTVASLLEQKEELLKYINEQEEIVEMDKNLFSVVEFGVRIFKPLSIGQRYLFLFPLILILLASLFYFVKFIKRKSERFAYSK